MGKHVKRGRHHRPGPQPKVETGVVIFTPPPPDPRIKIKDSICDLIEEGMWQRDAAILSGIDEATLYRWMDADASFASRVEQSNLKYKQKLIKVVNVGSIQKPEIAVKILEKRWAKEWDPPKQVELVDPDKQLSQTLSRLMGNPTTSKDDIMKDSDEPNTTSTTPAISGPDIPETS